MAKLMHSYATNSDERKTIPKYLIGASILGAFGLHLGLQIANIQIPWWWDAPSVVGIYGVFYNLFDKWLWQVPFMYKIRLVKIPNLNGNWKGRIISSYRGHKGAYNAIIKIEQSWTQIRINLQTKKSESHSLAGWIRTGNRDDATLVYEYLNEPKIESENMMQIHRGTARLTLSKSKNGKRLLKGDYYNGRGRLNYGALSFISTS